MRESHKMELTMDFNKIKFQLSDKQKMGNKYLFLRSFMGNQAIYFENK